MKHKRTPLALRVIKRREELRITQEGLARLAGLQVRVIAGIESGERRDPKHETLRRLAQALGLTLDHLIGRSISPSIRPRPSTPDPDGVCAPDTDLLAQTA